MHLNRLISVHLGTPQVVYEVEGLKQSKEPVKVVELALVEVVIGKPIGAIGALCEPVNQRDQESADVVSHGDGGPEESHGCASHALWGLVVEELHVPYGHEGLRHPVQAVLRHQPEH